MKRTLIAIIMMACVFCAEAATIDFSTGIGTTGNNLDSLTPSGSTVSVAEISGLDVTATFGAAGGSVDYLNSISTRLGVNSDLASEGTSYFDTGEWLDFSFDDKVNVTRFKFTDFTSGDSVKITWDTTVLTLTDADLNGSNEYTVDWTVESTESIRFDALGKSAATTAGGFGLVEMDMTVVPEPATVAMFGIGGIIAWVIRRSTLK